MQLIRIRTLSFRSITHISREPLKIAKTEFLRQYECWTGGMKAPEGKVERRVQSNGLFLQVFYIVHESSE